MLINWMNGLLPSSVSPTLVTMSGILVLCCIQACVRLCACMGVHVSVCMGVCVFVCVGGRCLGVGVFFVSNGRILFEVLGKCYITIQIDSLWKIGLTSTALAAVRCC